MCRRLACLIVILVFLIATIIRFVNFSDRVNFGPEQGISLSLSSDYLGGDWSLLGLVNVQRSTASGLSLFSGSLFCYSLVPLIFVLGKDPVVLTAYFALLNIFAGLLIYVFATRIFNWRVGLFSAAIFLFNDYMISHSFFIWILNYLPLIGLLTVWLLYRYQRDPKNMVLPLFLGVISGIGFNLEYVYVFTAVIVFTVMIIFSKSRFLAVALFLMGAFCANLPMVVFDLRHDFYHVRTLIGYLEKVATTSGESKISYYHFLQFWPLASIIFGIIFEKIFLKKKLLAMIALAIYIFINLTSLKVSFVEALGMGDNTRPVLLKDLDKTAQLIANDNPKDFNVVFYPGVDYRGYAIRYFLEYIYKVFPNSVENYPESKVLYVFADKDFSCQRGYPWEVSSFCSQGEPKVERERISEKYFLFKLTK